MVDKGNVDNLERYFENVSIVYGTSTAISAIDASYKEFTLLPIQIDLALLDNYGKTVGAWR